MNAEQEQYRRMRAWIEANHTEEELRLPASFCGGFRSWYFELARMDLFNDKLPEEFISMVQEYFDMQRAEIKEAEYKEPCDYIEVEVPNSTCMGNPPVYIRYYIRTPEMGE